MSFNFSLGFLKSICKAAVFAWAFLYMSLAYGQTVEFDPPLRLSEANPSASATINVPDGKVEVLRLVVFDPDNANEGRLYINGQGPIQLFDPPLQNSNNQTLPYDISLTQEQRSWFVPGNNVLRFFRDATQGYRVEAITILGDISLKEYAAITPVVDASVSPNRARALELYKRLVGVNTPIDNPVLVRMESQLNAGNALGAAQIATEEDGFFNHVVRDMAAKMSTLDESVKAPLNDMVAAFIGVTRDQLDARLLLTGNFYYMGNNGAAVVNNLQADVVESNNHYLALENQGYNLASVLERRDTQMVRVAGGNSLAANPDPAGVITSRSFMEAHATAGTNRRLVEQTMKQFTCNPIESWADATSSDARVGQDVGRAPGGEPEKFQTTCKACHANMDGFRGAFARVDFSNGFIKHADFYPNGDEDDPDAMAQNPIGVSAKYTRGADIFPNGYATVDASWVNFARSPGNMATFGWRGPTASGSGINQLATAVSNSRSFSTCMVKRVFTELCKREPVGFEQPVVNALADQFESGGYNLRRLFESVAVRPECFGR